MHYKNGREAKVGDKVVSLTCNAVGILHSINVQSNSCNGRIARVLDNDPYVTLNECLHMDDVVAVANNIANSSKI